MEMLQEDFDSEMEDEEGTVPAAIGEDDNDDETIIPLLPGNHALHADMGLEEDNDRRIHIVADNDNNQGLGGEFDAPAIINLDEGQLLGANNNNLDREEGNQAPRQPLPALVREGQDDPNRMILYNQEREWAKQIKAAVEDDPELDNLSDFAYAQYAISEPYTDTDSMNAVLERVAKMQSFREDKRILYSCSDGKKVIRDVIDLFPGFLLSLDFIERDGGYTFVFDSTKVLAPEFASNPKAYNIWASALYYVVTAASPDFESTRNGVTLHIECEGFDFMKNFGIKVFSKIWPELGDPIPTRWNALKHFHTSMFKNLLVSMAKRFIPKGIHKKMEVGCVCELGRLDKIYLVPNDTVSNQRFEMKFLECLQKRFDNEKAFIL